MLTTALKSNSLLMRLWARGVERFSTTSAGRSFPESICPWENTEELWRRMLTVSEQHVGLSAIFPSGSRNWETSERNSMPWVHCLTPDHQRITRRQVDSNSATRVSANESMMYWKCLQHVSAKRKA